MSFKKNNVDKSEHKKAMLYGRAEKAALSKSSDEIKITQVKIPNRLLYFFFKLELK
jgi:hypothetical protein